MKKFLLTAFLAVFLFVPAISNAWTVYTTNTVGGYYLTVNNNHNYILSCRAITNAYDIADFVVLPYISFSMWFSGPSLYNIRCW